MTKIRLTTLVEKEGESAILRISGGRNYTGPIVVYGGVPYVNSDDGKDYRVRAGTNDRISLFDRLGRHRVYDEITH